MGSDEHKDMLTLRLLGPFEVLVAGKPMPRLRTRKGQWLLALLALRHGQSVERNWLACTLWPDSLEEQALTNLRLSLSDLRHALGDQACRLQSPTPRTLRLDLSGADVDVAAFDRAISRGDAASLQEAVALYRGPLLEGCAEEWRLLERQAREQSYLQALETLAARALAKAETTAASGYLRRIVAIDPFRESAQRALMQALAAGGDYAAAVIVYRELRLRLHQELHSEPDAQTQTLFQQIRTQARSAGKLPVAGVESPAASGEKASTPSCPDTALADLPSGAPPTNLPVLWTSFIGREKELEEVESLLSQTRLLTLAGIGGCGKTRLSLQLATEALEDYPDGVWLVELASLSDPALVVQEVASVVGVREEAGNALLQTLIAHLRSRHLLLLLDNCEHLLAACAPLAETLLRSCPRLKILATSREALRIAGEQVYRVPSLPAPDPAQLPRKEKEIAAIVAEYEAVRLFVERARLQMPGFVLTRQNAPVVAAVCHRLDGIPLAIELAAARAPALSAEEILTRLEDRFRLLTGGSRTALPRQQTLQAALDWSYALLTEKERLLLGRLSVFAGGWTLEAADAVCSDAAVTIREMLDLLASLVEKSMVMAEPRDGKTRYRLLETIREYGRQRLQEAGEEKVWRDRHLAFFLRLAEEAAAKWRGAEQETWLERLESEHDNLRAALQWCRQSQDTTEAGLRLVGAMERFWEMRGYLGEGREHLQAALSQDTARSRTKARVKALLGAGGLAAEQADYAAAGDLYTECLALSRELDDKQGVAAVRNHQGLVAWYQGEHAAARSLFEESLALYRELGDTWGIASTLGHLGLTYSHSDYGVAGKLYEESLAMKRALGDRRGISVSLIYLGNVSLLQGNYSEAQALYEEGLDVSRALGDKCGMGHLLENLGCVAHKQGDRSAAQALFEQSLEIRKEIGDKQGIACSLGNLGDLAKDREDYAAASALYEECLALFRELADKEGIAITLGNLGAVACSQGDTAAADRLYAQSLAISRDMGDRRGIGCALQEIADLAAEQGQTERAARLWAAAEALRDAMGAPLPPGEQVGYERKVAVARTSLGEATFKNAWGQGRAMTVEEAIAYALDVRPHPLTPSPS